MFQNMERSGVPTSGYGVSNYGVSGDSVSDYYEPYARLVLSRPLVIGGQFGCGTRLIARSLCASTGLPFVDVDRKIEHEAGRSLARIAHEEGLGRVEEWSTLLLERVVSQRPCAVIVFDHAWPSDEIASLFGEKCDFIHVERDVVSLVQRASKDLSGTASWLAAEGLSDASKSDDWTLDRAIEAIFARRAALLQTAGTLIAAEGLHAHEVAQLLRESLEPFAASGPRRPN